ncbi:Mu-type opioid receptor [Tupaia chinensis]|uniref:Mu-type opioid receptor n=1 Tax=Tupaia chinensis TaxID=246437 RepID=L9LDH4_TUPCH|nr:Mu-type opioid receptor [Tupaia chinensis]
MSFTDTAVAPSSSGRYTKMKTATNIYIFNLALADALATSTLPFQSVNYLMGTWPFGTILCKIVISIDYYNMFTSIFTLCTMSVDRYIAVCHPVKALDFRTPRNAKIVNVCNWIISSAIGLPVMFMATTKYRHGSIDCTLTFSHPAWYWENLLKICVFIFAFVMPVLIITVCYGLMILRLKSVRMLSGSKEKDRNLRRITRMVLVVVAVFIVCWTPIHIYVIIKALITIPETTFQTVSWHFCIALGYTNSCLNPVLYAFLDENFKRCFREFCIPTSSTIEQQNSTRIRQNTRDHPSTANTVDRTNHQGMAAWCHTLDDCQGPLLSSGHLSHPSLTWLLEIEPPVRAVLSCMKHDCPSVTPTLPLTPSQSKRFHISVALAQPERGKKKLIGGVLFPATKRFAVKIHPIKAYPHGCPYEAASNDSRDNELHNWPFSQSAHLGALDREQRLPGKEIGHLDVCED